LGAAAGPAAPPRFTLFKLPGWSCCSPPASPNKLSWTTAWSRRLGDCSRTSTTTSFSNHIKLTSSKCRDQSDTFMSSNPRASFRTESLVTPGNTKPFKGVTTSNSPLFPSSRMRKNIFIEPDTPTRPPLEFPSCEQYLDRSLRNQICLERSEYKAARGLKIN
jgi:hypothetical protein